MDVSFQPQFGGITVSVTDTVGAGKQNCTYDAHPEFVLPSSGTTTFNFPGIATSTLWRVHIECSFDPPNPFAKPGLFDDTHEY